MIDLEMLIMYMCIGLGITTFILCFKLFKNHYHYYIVDNLLASFLICTLVFSSTLLLATPKKKIQNQCAQYSIISQTLGKSTNLETGIKVLLTDGSTKVMREPFLLGDTICSKESYLKYYYDISSLSVVVKSQIKSL